MTVEETNKIIAFLIGALISGSIISHITVYYKCKKRKEKYNIIEGNLLEFLFCLLGEAMSFLLIILFIISLTTYWYE